MCIRDRLARGEQVFVVCPLVGKDAEARDAKAAGRTRDADAAGEEYHPACLLYTSRIRRALEPISR